MVGAVPGVRVSVHLVGWCIGQVRKLVMPVDDEARGCQTLAQDGRRQGVRCPHPAQHSHSHVIKEHGSATPPVAQCLAEAVSVRGWELDGVATEYQKNVGCVHCYYETALLVMIFHMGCACSNCSPPFQSKRQQEAETHHIRSSTVALHPVPAPTSLYCATWIGVAFAQAKRAPTKQANGRLHGNFPARSTKILAPEGVQVRKSVWQFVQSQ